MKLTKVEFIVKGEKVKEYINLEHVSRLLWIDGVPYVGMVGQTFTRQLAAEYEKCFIGLIDL